MSDSILRRRSGRPPAPPETLRSNRVVTFVTDRELSDLRALSVSRNLSLSAACHCLISSSLANIDNLSSSELGPREIIRGEEQ